MFNGHIDTNPVTGGWTVDPWGGIHDGDFIYGIGVSNMKAGDAAAFMAVKTLVDAGIAFSETVLVTADGPECLTRTARRLLRCGEGAGAAP